LPVDEKGFPLAISSFEGNKAETKTMLPILKEFRRRCKVEELTVVADAGMLSIENKRVCYEFKEQSENNYRRLSQFISC
jgi:transposase